jgi:hypothetical protein
MDVTLIYLCPHTYTSATLATVEALIWLEDRV